MQECWFGTTQFIMEKDSFQLKCCNNHCMLPKLGICPCDRNIVINKSIFITNSCNLSSGYYLKYCGRYVTYYIWWSQHPAERKYNSHFTDEETEAPWDYTIFPRWHSTYMPPTWSAKSVSFPSHHTSNPEAVSASPGPTWELWHRQSQKALSSQR